MLSSPTDARNCGNGVKFGIQNYEIPPAPRPLGKISSPHYTAGSTLQQTTPSCAPSNISIEVLRDLKLSW